MNNKTATRLLRSYRSDGSDANDPVFREALKQTQQDPGLGQWFKEEQSLDEAIFSKLADTPVPSSLRDDILAMKAVHEQARPGYLHRWRGGGLLAVAAALLLMVGGGLFWMNQQLPPLSFDNFPQTVARFMETDFELDLVMHNLAGAEQWMNERGFSGSLPVPEALAQATDRGVGCAPFDWHGEQVLLFCFWLDDGTALHYFVMDADALPGAPSPGEMRMARHRGYQTITWKENGFAFVLTTSNFDLDTRTLLLDRMAGKSTPTRFPKIEPTQWGEDTA